MRRPAVLGVAVLVVVVLGVGQLVLPGIAAQRIRSQLDRYGHVGSVSVSAFPAIELLWHHADSVTVKLVSFRAGSGSLTDRLRQLNDVGTVHASATRATVGLLTVRDARLVKHGSSLVASAHVTDADLRRSLPVVRSVTPVASSRGALTLRGTADVFGQPVSVDFTARAVHGALVVSPDVPFGSVAAVTVFSDPDVQVTGVRASPAPGGFVVRATATLR
ncbi:MAG TPA: hypothetical protein VFW09_12120 [Solirubrobacteraceae bacterium]|nr:hypothetical protein [Solirubrobacteraceae bacterium]